MQDFSKDIIQRAEKLLMDKFGLTEFRSGQEQIIRSILMHHSTLAVMPTGAGKSLCYQLPAMMTPGLTLVISPLIALMKDQVDALQHKGIAAAYLHSGVDYMTQNRIISDVQDGRIRMLFVAPERFRNSNFQELLRNVQVGLLAVDEAHCISQWGHDFRPDYRRIGELRHRLGNPPTIALTATASPEVQQDIVNQLELENPDIHILGFDRPNLLYKVKRFKTQEQKLEWALSFIRGTLQQAENDAPPYKGCGLLYASTRKQAEQAMLYLREHGVYAGLYHAGLSDEERARVQDRFMNDDYHCLVATTAFGMGVDKPDIRYVIHLALSSSIEAYTQEAGRAGRDRQPSQCILLYCPADMRIQEFFIENSYPDASLFQEICDFFIENAKTPQVAQGLTMDQLKSELTAKNKTGLETALRKMRAMDIIDLSPDNNIRWLRTPDKREFNEMIIGCKIQKNLAQKRVKSLMNYVYEENCRTKFILKYFGSKDARSFRKCYHCDLCHASYPSHKVSENTPFPPEPLLFPVLKVLSTVARRNGHEDARGIAGILRADDRCSDVQKKVSTWGLLSYFSEQEIRVFVSILSDQHFIWMTPTGYRLAETGIQHLKTTRFADLPNSLRLFLRERFPQAPGSGEPWRPHKTENV